jgi:shikimate dehydrogenase
VSARRPARAPRVAPIVAAPLKLAVLGDPLVYTRSPELHRAGLDALRLGGESRAIRTSPAELGARLRELAEAGYRGVNLTHPLKQAALEHLGRVSASAKRALSVNTVGFEPGLAWGETTDGAGFLDLLRSRGRDPAAQAIVLLGAGGAARSLALALAACGCRRIAASARRIDEVRERWDGIASSTLVEWRSAAEATALATASVVVNATPLAGEEGAAPLDRLPRAALIVDLVYGPEITPWVRHARSAGLEAYDGLGLLAFQARRSLALWTGREVPLDPLMRAVGWPR